MSGVIVTIDGDGLIDVQAGMVKPEDIPREDPGDQATGDGVTNLDRDCDNTGHEVAKPVVIAPTSNQPIRESTLEDDHKVAKGMSDALRNELRATRHQITQAHLAADFAIAFDVMLYGMATSALGSNSGNEAYDWAGSNSACDVIVRKVHHSNMPCLDGSVADKMLQALYNELNLGWKDLSSPKDFEAMCALTDEEKQALFAYCTAQGLIEKLSDDTYAKPMFEVLGKRLNIDLASIWRPSAKDFWGRLKKVHLFKIAEDQIGADFVVEHKNARLADLADLMDGHFNPLIESEGVTAEQNEANGQWLPDGMAFDGVLPDEDTPVSENPEDADESEAQALPAFLSEEAA